ncbi:MAG: NACHT and WD repeat domain-containing protein [Solirubrobacteraceae bacterium]
MVEQRSPFQGLGFYTEDDARWFFGRATERKIILAHLRTARLTLLYAESGVGKSSLLRAGVAARLRELAMQNIDASRSPKFVPLVFSDWKDDPVEDLISEIQRQVHVLRPASNGAGPAGTASNGSLADAITAAGSALDATLVIILDQFEEHFSYRLGAGRPNRLADELAQCVNAPTVPANFLIAVREDAYGGLGDLFSGRISNVYNNYLHLEYLTRDAAREAIEKPVEIYNADHPEQEPIKLDEDLADAVLDEVRRGNIELGTRRGDRDGGNLPAANADEIETPFLQLVMSRLWECELAKGSRVLRTATLNDELGGAETIVRNHVDRALTGLAGEELEAATDILHDLVTPSGVKVAHTAGDLAQMTAHSETTVGSVLDRLYEERIVRAVDPAPGSSQARYEIFHDRLAAPILDWRQQRENARQDRARERAEREAEVQRNQARRFKRLARIMLALAVGLLVLLVAVAVLLGYAQHQSDTASREKTAALKGTAEAKYFGLTARAQSQLPTRPDVSLLLYLAAYDQSPQPAAERSLLATLHSVQLSGAVGILHGHTDAVESIAFSPVGSTLASASGDKTIRLWTVTRTGQLPLGQPLRANGPLYSVAFDRTGQLLASGSFNDIILWSIRRHARQGTIRDATGAVTSVAFSRHGNMLAAGGSDGTVLLWNTLTHQSTKLHIPSGGLVRSVAFNPRGDELATSSDKSVVLWNVATGAMLGQLSGPTRVVYSVAFSPDGQTIAAGGSNGTIARWSASSLGELSPELHGLRLVNSLAFSPDGRALAAGGTNKTMLWDLAAGKSRGEALSGHQGGVNSVAFSPNGKRLAAGGADRTITLWSFPIHRAFGKPLVRFTKGGKEVAFSPNGRVIASAGDGGQIYVFDTGGRLLRTLAANQGDPIESLAFDPTGRTLGGAYGDGGIRLWDVATGRQLGGPLRGNTHSVQSIEFDRTGTRLVSGGADGTIRLWDVRRHTEIGHPLKSGFGSVYAVAFSPDGAHIAAGGDGRAIRLWDSHTEAQLRPGLIAQNGAVFSLAFSPDGRLLASGGADDTIHLWRAQAHAYIDVHTLTGDTHFIRSVAFSHHGQTLASGSTDTTVRLWDTATGAELGTPLTGHLNSVESVAFSPDGTRLVSGSTDNTVRLWQAVKLPPSFAQLHREVCSFLGAGLSRAEWLQYAPDVPYQQTCPRTTPS